MSTRNKTVFPARFTSDKVKTFAIVDSRHSRFLIAFIVLEFLRVEFDMLKSAVKMTFLKKFQRGTRAISCMAEDERESQRSFSGTRKRAQTTTSSFGVSKREGHDASQYYNSKMNKGLVSARDVGPAQTFPASLENSIHCHDSRHLDFIPDNCVDLVVTSPPYNVTKDYDDDLSLEQYLTLLHDVFSECFWISFGLLFGGPVRAPLALQIDHTGLTTTLPQLDQ